jgi:5-formyltetrahydrofolate cyclo-ligase
VLPILAPDLVVAASKAAIRQSMRARLAATKPTAEDAQRAWNRLQPLLCATRGDAVALFMGGPHELPTSGLMEQLRKRGMRAAAPRVHGPELVFHLVNEDTPMQLSSFRVLEPPPSAPVIHIRDCACVMVPALAVDELGHRLGHGKGLYDRTLTQVPQQRRIAWVRDDAVYPGVLPVDSHDQQLGWWVTPSRTWRAHEGESLPVLVGASAAP